MEIFLDFKLYGAWERKRLRDGRLGLFLSFVINASLAPLSDFQSSLYRLKLEMLYLGSEDFKVADIRCSD